MKQLTFSVVALSLLAVSACAGAKEQLGLTPNAPDEFKVVKRAPLEMPANFGTLPPPRPGAKRPQERAVSEQIKTSVIGSPQKAEQQSAGEKALLDAAGAQQADRNIRRTVDQEQGVDSERDKPVIERLTGVDIDGSGADKTIDPAEEAERLKRR